MLYGRELRAIWRLGSAQRSHDVQVTARLCADDFGVVRRAVIAGAGIGLMPVLACADDLRKKRLRNLLPEHSVEGGGLYLVYPSARSLSAASRAFIDFATKELAHLAVHAT